MLRILIILMPIFFLLVPPSASGILETLLLYLVLCFIINRYKKDIKIIFTTGKSKLCIYLGIVIDIILVVLFFLRWLPSGVVRGIAQLFYVDEKYFLLAIGIVLLISALKGIFCVLAVLIDVYKNRNEIFQEQLTSRTDMVFESTALTVIFWVSQSGLPLWGNSDNYWISCVLNGVYSSENYCVFLSYLLSRFIKVINGFIPTADGFVLISEILVLSGIWCLLYILYKNARRYSVLIVFLFIMAFNFQLNLLHAPFTLLTGEVIVLGILGVHSWIRRKVSVGVGLWGGFLIVMGGMMRFNALLLCLPFVALILVSDMICILQKRHSIQKYLLRFGALLIPIMVSILFVVGVEKSVDRKERYSAAIEYNTSRSKLVDFPTKSWDEVADELQNIGVSKNDYLTVKNLILADTDNITTDYMDEILESSEVVFFEGLLERGSVRYEVAVLLKRPEVVAQLFLLLMLTFFVCISNCDYFRKLEVVLCNMGATIITIYFMSVGHFPGYLFYTIMMYVWCVLFTVYMESKITIARSLKTKHILAGMAMIILVNNYAMADFSNNNGIIASLLSKTGRTSDIVQVDSNDNTMYIWGVYDLGKMLSTTSLWSDGKLLSEEFLRHNVVDGEWTYGQVYYEDYFKRIGMDNPMKALLDREHTYYVANNERCQMILTYLQEHYDKKAGVKLIGFVQDVPIWQFYEGGEKS